MPARPAAPAGGGGCEAAPERARRERGGVRPRARPGLRARGCVTDFTGVACNSLIWKALLGLERFAGPLWSGEEKTARGSL